MRLIDADKADRRIRQFLCGGCDDYHNCGNCLANKALSLLRGEQTVDVEPVKHGYWISDEARIKDQCSVCGLSVNWSQYKTPYCPFCGAKMDAPTQKSVGNALEALDRWKKEPEINPCRGCEDYDGKGGCLSHGGCGEGREDG